MNLLLCEGEIWQEGEEAGVIGHVVACAGEGAADADGASISGEHGEHGLVGLVVANGKNEIIFGLGKIVA